VSQETSSHSSSQQPLLQQAPVVPLDASGRTASVLGFIFFVLCTVVSYIVAPGGGWFYVFATGTVIGLVLILLTTFHRLYRLRQVPSKAHDEVISES
jgi:hypothetical protein